MHLREFIQKEIYRYVCMYDKRIRMDKTQMRDKKHHFISKMVGSYTKDLLNTGARVQEFLHYHDKSDITGTSTMLQLLSSKFVEHGYTVGHAFSTIFSSFVVALMANVRKGVTMSSHSLDGLELM